jgi:protein-S-isoprenylcysteine O-methyltransferase Ste14
MAIAGLRKEGTKQLTDPNQMSLRSRLAVRFSFGVTVGIAVLFIPAGSFHFWEGWVFVAEMVVASLFMSIYFYRHDRGLLERRLETQEKESTQRIFRKLFAPLWSCSLILCGFDYRFGWSASFFGHVPPLWLTIVAQALVMVAYWLVFQVMKANSFASSVIQVEARQTVISTGPYRLVRHPMYSAISLMLLATPLALGSYVAVPLFVLLIPLLVFRLFHEEQLLRQKLPGYTEYCQRTRFRLVPFVV